MIIKTIRSSALSTWEFCPFKYFLSYNLGIQEPGNRKAIHGTICHKALECLALKKLAIQNNQKTFTEDEGEKTFNISVSNTEIIKYAYSLITKKEKHLDWDHLDFIRCQELFNKALIYDDGRFNPLNQKIVNPETKFEFELKEPEFYYDFGKHGSGYLKIRGTMDLIVEEDGLYHLIDYKTGKRYNWGKDKEKTYNDLCRDEQLCLYHFAAKQLYPDKEFIVTIYYIDFDEPITLSFDDNTIGYTKNFLKQRFKEIKNTFYPKQKFSWKCEKLCMFGKKNLQGDEVKGYKGSMCDCIGKEVQQIGLEKVFANRCIDKSFTNYTGGGRSDKGEQK